MTCRSAILLTAACVLAAALCLAEEQAEPPRVRLAVVGFRNLRPGSDADWIGPATAETLTTRLAAVSALLVVEREQISKVIEEQQFQQTDLADPQSCRKVGKLLGAEWVVLGSYVVVDGQVQFNLRIVNVETGEVLNAATVRSAEADVMDLPGRLADAVIRSFVKKVRIEDEELKALARRATSNPDAYRAFGRGVELDGRHRWREAEGEFRNAVQLDPDFALAWFQLGRMHYNQGAWDNALECYARAQALFKAAGDEKDLAWALKNIGNVRNRQGAYAEAMKYYEAALAVSRRLRDEPCTARLLHNIGMVQFRQGRFPEAMKCDEESLLISRRIGDEGGVAATLHNMGGIHQSFYGRNAEALACYEEALAIRRRLWDDPGAASTLYNMAGIYVSMKQLARALSLAGEAADLAHKVGLPDAAKYDKLVAQLRKVAAQ